MRLDSQLNDMQNLLAEVGRTGSDTTNVSEDLKASMKAFDQARIDVQRVTTDLRGQLDQVAFTLSARATQLSAQLRAIKSVVGTARISLAETSVLTHGVSGQTVNI